MKHEDAIKSPSGPTFVFFSIWNWFATLPKTVSNLYVDIKNGELLAKFSLLDAMLQFIFAVATSCHPPEEGIDFEVDENKSSDGSSKTTETKVFSGAGRSLRSRTVEANS